MKKQINLDRSSIEDNRLNGARGVVADVGNFSINGGDDEVIASLKFAGVRHQIEDETKDSLPFYNPDGMLLRPPTCPYI